LHYCRVYETTGTTPAVALGIADHVWSIGELLHAALAQEDRPEAGARYGRFTVIDGGRARADRLAKGNPVSTVNLDHLSSRACCDTRDVAHPIDF